MLHWEAGTSLFPFPATPVTNTVTHSLLLLQLKITPCRRDTQQAPFLSWCSSYHRNTIIHKIFFPPSTFLFPLIGKNKLALSWQICLSKANVASSNTVSQKMIRELVQRNESSYLSKWEEILFCQTATQSSRTENPRIQNGYHSSAIALAEWILQSVVQL